ncbi:MAG TPA: hypothetical protein VGB84_05300 [Arachidicoccus sp.]
MKELTINNDYELIDFANSLGKPIPSRVQGPLIDNLIPLYNNDAHEQSLSAKYGINDFPFHTDGAYFEIPPRYIVLRYIRGIDNPTPTVVCDMKNIVEKDKNMLKHSIWKVKSRSGFFLSTILSEENNVFRYDKCVMQPSISHNNNSQYFEDLVSGLPKEEIRWSLNKTVVLDNWTFLHSRPKVKNMEINFRTLQRIMIL